jgi:hypothetical protein
VWPQPVGDDGEQPVSQDTGRKGKNVRTINLCTQPFELLDNRKANIRQSVSPMAELHPALTGHRIPGAELALASL